MPENNQQIPLTAPVHRSLSRPILLAGCDRPSFMILSILSVFIAGPMGFVAMRPFIGVFGIALFFVGRWFLTKLSQDDPTWKEVHFRSMRYRDFYPAIPRYDEQDQTEYSRW